MNINIFIKDAAGMQTLGKSLAQCIQPGQVIYLSGELGAGKTTLVQGFLEALGYKKIVHSPTYTLVETYQLSNQTIHHFDFYRIHQMEELELIGIRDYFTKDAVCLIEWPERAKSILPEATLHCTMQLPHDLIGRFLEFSACSSDGIKIIECVNHLFKETVERHD